MRMTVVVKRISSQWDHGRCLLLTAYCTSTSHWRCSATSTSSVRRASCNLMVTKTSHTFPLLQITFAPWNPSLHGQQPTSDPPAGSHDLTIQSCCMHFTPARTPTRPPGWSLGGPLIRITARDHGTGGVLCCAQGKHTAGDYIVCVACGGAEP